MSILHSDVSEIFNIIEDKDKRSRTIYRLQFKNDLSLLKDGMCLDKHKANYIACRWIKKNPKQVSDIKFELEVLLVKTKS